MTPAEYDEVRTFFLSMGSQDLAVIRYTLQRDLARAEAAVQGHADALALADIAYHRATMDFCRGRIALINDIVGNRGDGRSR